MAQNVAAVKNNMASQLSNMAAALIKLVNQANEITAEYFADGFNSGGSNPITQADLDASTNTFLTPTIVGNVVTQLQTLGSTFGSAQLNVLRQAIPTPQI